jgi:hypothetical protein
VIIIDRRELHFVSETGIRKIRMFADEKVSPNQNRPINISYMATYITEKRKEEVHLYPAQWVTSKLLKGLGKIQDIILELEGIFLTIKPYTIRHREFIENGQAKQFKLCQLTDLKIGNDVTCKDICKAGISFADIVAEENSNKRPTTVSQLKVKL